MTKVKICGLSEEVHVEQAIAAGADAIGFVFASSRRQISMERAHQLTKRIPPSIEIVGVFVNETKERIEEIAENVPLTMIQLHGDESAEFASSLSKPVVKAFSIQSMEDLQHAISFPSDYILLDAPGDDFRGGSGHVFDWHLADGISLPTERLIIAGGLHAHNVQQAIRQFTPAMVDVSSGVETNKRKDSSKIHAFIEAAKQKEQ